MIQENINILFILTQTKLMLKYITLRQIMRLTVEPVKHHFSSLTLFSHAREFLFEIKVINK